jgi:hypothetical protein
MSNIAGPEVTHFVKTDEPQFCKSDACLIKAIVLCKSYAWRLRM